MVFYCIIWPGKSDNTSDCNASIIHKLDYVSNKHWLSDYKLAKPITRNMKHILYAVLESFMYISTNFIL